jgi:hypothetical protein
MQRPITMRITLPDTSNIIKRIDALEKRIDALKINHSFNNGWCEFFIQGRLDTSLRYAEPASANGGSAHNATPR